MRKRIPPLAVRLLCVAMLASPPLPAMAQARDVQIIAPGFGAGAQHVNLPLNKSIIVNLPRDARDVLVANPDIVDAVIRTPRQAYLLGRASGDTSVYFLDGAGNQILDLQIRVDRDMSGLQNMLARYVPNAPIAAEAVGDGIVLTGTTRSTLDADRAVQIAQSWAGAPENVLSLLSIDGAEQVMLKIRVVEMQRSLLKQLGINWNTGVNFGEFDPAELANLPNRVDQFGNPVFEAVDPGRFDYGFQFGTNNGFGVNGGSQGGLTTGITGNNYYTPGILGAPMAVTPGQRITNQGGDVLQSMLGANINALERSGLVRTLQEPNLTAVSGREADFFAGGRFPVPSGRDEDGNVQVEYMDFGVGLTFTPVVMSGGRMSLSISTEVSDLSNQGALTLPGQPIRNTAGAVIGSTAAVTIPALTVRRAQTTVEMSSGGAIVIAGLIADETRQSIDGLPGLKDLPILGALFRSDDFLSEQTELVIIATPYLVQQTSPENIVTPIDGLRVADGPESFLLGRLNSVYAAPGADAGGRTWQGPHGFVTDTPGATP